MLKIFVAIARGDFTRKIINNLNKRKEVSPFYQENVGGPPDQNPNYSPWSLFLCENLFRFCSFLLLDGSSPRNSSVLDAHAKLINGSCMYGGNSSLFTTPLSSSLKLISWFGYAVLSPGHSKGSYMEMFFSWTLDIIYSGFLHGNYYFLLGLKKWKPWG